MATIKDSAPHAHPSTEDHDHPHACTDGVVYVGHLVEDPGTGEEIDDVVALPCRRCAGEDH